ncbi:MAG: phosphocholine cytidylyltransferase family protein [Lachnospiraceae bacterium]|nr:phosphocholine cytidylyltransferase family protein [Lachnospiraceae bacterium]
MRVLLLAAGKGTRISRYLAGNPKCTVDIGNERLICYTINMLRSKGVTNIGVVLGYRDNVVRDTIHDEGIQYYYNPFFDVTNSVASAWFAKEFIKENEDVIIMNADVYMDEKIMDIILNCKKNPVLFADSRRKEEADYKFKYHNDVLEKYGKDLTGEDITGEYIGVAKIGRDFLPTFLERMEKMIKNQNHSVWWENVLYDMIPEQKIFVEEIGENFWAEVDYIEDYERILNFRNFEMNFSAKEKGNC